MMQIRLSESLSPYRPSATKLGRWPLHALILAGNLVFLVLTIVTWRDGNYIQARETFNSEQTLELHFALRGRGANVLTISEAPETSRIPFERQRRILRVGDISPYSDAPSPQVDAAWNEITSNPDSKVGDLLVSETNVPYRRESTIKLPTGEYLALADIFHELHCLDELRKRIYMDQYPDRFRKNEFDEKIDAIHTIHCIDSLRLALMCTADISLVTVKVVPHSFTTWPEFYSTHKCRNWDQLMDWAKKEFHREQAVVKAHKTVMKHPVLGFPKPGDRGKAPLSVAELHYVNMNGEIIEG